MFHVVNVFTLSFYNVTGTGRTTCGFLQNCPEVFLHLQYTQQGIPICLHAQCWWNTSYSCMFELDSLVHCLCENLVQGSHSCLHIHSSLDQHSHFVDNESVYRLFIDTLVYVNVNQNWWVAGNGDH